MTNHQRVTRADIMDLLSRRFPSGVLSVYVGLSPNQRHDPQNWISAVRSGLKDLAQKRPADSSLARVIELAHIELMQLPVDARHRSLVYFRSLEPDWGFRRSPQSAVATTFAFDQAPQIRPLIALLEETPVVGAAVLSQSRVRLFTWKEGMIEEAPELQVGREEEERVSLTRVFTGILTRSGVPVRPPKNRRDDRARRQQRSVARRLGELGRDLGWQKLLLIGHGVPTAAVASHLQDRWRRLLIPSLDRNLIKAHPSEVAEAIGRQVRMYKQRAELAEVEDLVQETLARGRSCTRIDHCLESLNKGGIERLLLSGDLKLHGYRDAGGKLYLDGPGPGFVPEPRLVERMIAAAMESGAEVVLLEGEASERLKLLGGVGGRLRWKEALSDAGAEVAAESEGPSELPAAGEQLTESMSLDVS
jgi:hypothetical protein